ncbi:MAG TPA: hypothetical protein VFM69_06490 [Pricia sp.]|nr:hypothetical protein [Pricia sp.]
METATEILKDIVMVILWFGLAVVSIWIIGALTVFLAAKIKTWFK